MAPAAVPSSSSARMSPYISSSQPGGGEKSDLLKGLQDVYWSDEEEEDPECPLCMEEMDLSDINFKPCPCGYQICRFCHHHILANLNKRCPACRRQYTEDGIEFIPVGAEEIKRLTALKRTKAKTNKELEALGRRHLKDVRVVVKNMVYVVGMGVGQEGRAEEQLATLRSNDYFGQYGKISKLVLHKRPPSAAPPPSSSSPPPPNVGIYITYLRREDAARAISALDGFPSPSAPGQVLRASFGTTKYCEAWLRGVKCDNVNCLGLHDWGDERDCFTKEDLSTLKHTLKGTEHLQKPVIVSRPVVKKVEEIPDASALPRTASWASRPGTGLASLPPNPTLPAPPGLKAQQPTPAQSAPVVIRLQTTKKTVAASPAASTSTPVTILAKPTPVKSSSKTIASTAASSVSAPSNPSSRPGTPAATPAKASIGIVSSTTNRATTSTATPATPAATTTTTTTAPPTHSTPTPAPATPSPAPAPPPPPPPPPGLGPPGLAQQPAPPPNLEPIPAHLQSPYQPSTQTQALVDEITARREAPGPPAFASSPFPDFDHMLSTFGDGQFSFNLNLDQQKGSSSSRSRHAEPELMPPSAFSPFGFGLPSQGSSFGLLPTEPRLATPYAGSFDPWGDAPRPPTGPEGEGGELGGKKSRFDFARRKASNHDFGGSPSPSARSLALPHVDGDSRRGSIDSDSLRPADGANGAGGGRFNRDSGRITPTPSSTDASSYLWSGTSGHHDPPPHQHPHHHQQSRSNASSPAPFGRAAPPGLAASSGPGHLARQSSNTSSSFPHSPAPPGLGLKSPLQGQQHQQLHHQQPGGPGNWIHQLPQQQQQGSIGGDASRMAFARQQQQQQGFSNGANDRTSQAQALKDMLGVGSGMNLGGGGGMGMGMGLGMGGGGGAEHNHMPFQDPAIMSMRMNTAAQQQQHYANNSSNGQQQQPFSPDQQQQQLGMHGVGGTTELGAFAAFASQSLNVGNARLLQQIQHQQQQHGYYGVQGGGSGGRGPSPSPPLDPSRPASPAVSSAANPFDFPALSPAPTPMTSTHASRFIQAQAAHEAAQPKSSHQSPPTPSSAGKGHASPDSSTPVRPTGVQIAIQSATPDTPQAEWSPDVQWQADSPSRLGAQGWTPGLERRRSLELIEGRLSREEEDKVEELVGEAAAVEVIADAAEDEELRKELEEVEKQVEALEGIGREQTKRQIKRREEAIAKQRRQEQEQFQQQQLRHRLQKDQEAIQRAAVISAEVEEQARQVAEQQRAQQPDSPSSSPELPTVDAPATPPDADVVRAAVRAAAAEKPKPVTISLGKPKLAAVQKPVVATPEVAADDKKGKLATATPAAVAIKSQQSTPITTRPGTPSKTPAVKATGKQTKTTTAPAPVVETPPVIKAAPDIAPVAAKAPAVASSAPKTKLQLHKEAQALALAKAAEAAAARAAARPAVPVAASMAPAVEQAAMTSKMAKKAKAPKAKKLHADLDDVDADGYVAAVEDANAGGGDDLLELLAEDEIIVEGDKDQYKITEQAVESTLPELLNQVSYLIDCNHLAFFSPTLPCTSLPLPATADPALTPSNLALALSALSSSNPTVSMEEAVGSFHVLLTHLTGRISEVLGVLPKGGREGTHGMALGRRFEGMFGGEDGGDGFEELDYDDEDEQAAGKGDEVDRLRGALGRRAGYLARQLGRLEELHGEINGIALDALLPRYAATAPSYASTSAQSSLQIEEELERAREMVEQTTRELEIVMHENTVAFGEYHH